MSESIKLKIGLSGTYWDRQPKFKIILSEKEYFSGSISKPSGEVEYFEFPADLEDGEQSLDIQLLEKEFSDVQKNEDGSIANDQLLNIESIEIDDIDLGNLKYTASIYTPSIKQEYNGEIIEQLPNCVNLGWNGTYSIKFNTPFYIWLLENL